MSSSDYITMKKYKNMRNIFTTKESGNNIQRLKINTILNGYKVDEYDDIIPNKWFNVKLSCPPRDPCNHFEEVEEVENFCCDDNDSNDESEAIGDEVLCCSHSIIYDVTDTRPIMFKTPSMTIEPAIKKRCYPFYCGCCNPPPKPQPPMPSCHQSCLPENIVDFIEKTQLCTQSNTQVSTDCINLYFKSDLPVSFIDGNNFIINDIKKNEHNIFRKLQYNKR